jgi:hypothetical protein
MFGAFAGSGRSFEASVRVSDARTSALAFAYNVKKSNFQSAAEAFAKHLNKHITGLSDRHARLIGWRASCAARPACSCGCARPCRAGILRRFHRLGRPSGMKAREQIGSAGATVSSSPACPSWIRHGR